MMLLLVVLHANSRRRQGGLISKIVCVCISVCIWWILGTGIQRILILVNEGTVGNFLFYKF